MEEIENLLPENDNNNNNIMEPNNLQNNAQLMPNELEGEDYQIIIFNFFPSLFYIIIISIILFIPDNKYFSNINEIQNIDQFRHIFSYLQIMRIIYIFYIIKAIFYYLSIKKFEINNIYYKMIISFLYTLVDIFYYIFTVGGYYSFRKLSFDFIIYNLYICIFIYFLIFIGVVHTCLFFISCIYICLSFIFSLNSFLDNEMDFIINQGELPEIFEQLLDNQKADSNHCGTCHICLENIEKGQDIIILKCNDLHYFHDECIKSWLKYHISCPLCRKKNIL